MTGRSTGRIALVTGASRGIGRAIALRLAREGVSVVVNYAGNAEAAHRVVADVERSGGKAIAVQADVSKFADVTRLFDVTIEQFGRLDILVNNAGIFFTKPLDEVTEEDFDRIVGVNIKGIFFACQQAARGMADGGRIVNFSSSTTAMMLPRYSAYVDEGGGGAAHEIAGQGAGAAGWIDGQRRLAGPGGHRAVRLRQDRGGPGGGLRDQPFDRLGRPEDVADVVAFLVSDDAHWVTGQNIRANGGVI